MRFDDSLKTVLAAEAATALGARTAFRQLVDLIGRGRAPASEELLARLERLRPGVPVTVRVSCARSLALADAPVALVAFLADDEPEVAGAALRAARLDPADWEALLPRLTPLGRSVLRLRRDLAPSVTRALTNFGATDFLLGYRPAAGGVGDDAMGDAPVTAARFAVTELVGRLRAYQRAHVAPVEPADITPLAGFQFETDAGGVIRWVDAGPRGAVIGLTLSHAGADSASSSVDGIAAGAFRKRATFSDARLLVPGESAISGDWRIAGVPMFDPVTGSFVGVRGTARRPRADESATRRADRAQAAGAEGLRRLVHELRTPTNAIAGFSELIEQELLGPVEAVYRDRASEIRRRVGGLIGAIEDLDLAARIDGAALDLRPGAVPASSLLHRVAEDLRPLAALRGAGLVLPPPSDAAWLMDLHNAERLVSRLLATMLSAARPGEYLPLALIHGTGTVALTVAAPAAFAARDEATLLALDDEDALADDGAPLLGVGFALRLVRNLATELGGRFVYAPDRFTLLLPSTAAVDGGQATTTAP